MVNTSKIKGRLRELGLTQKNVAHHLKIALPTASQKINNRRPMTLNEALVLAVLLKIEDRQFKEFFFDNQLHNATRLEMVKDD